MTDLLSAASLLLTAITIIYGLWYPQMVEVLDTVPALHPEDRVKSHRDVSRIISTRTAPLLLISAILTLIFVPDSWRIICASFGNFRLKGLAAARDYDAVATSFVVVTCLLGFLTTHLSAVTKQLFTLRGKLNPN